MRKIKKKMQDRFFLTTPTDHQLIVTLVLINIFGLIMIYSASFYYGPYAYGYTPQYIFMSQLKYVVPGILFMLLLSFFRPRFWQYFWIPAIVFAFCLLVAVKIPGIGWASHGAYRWIKIGPVKFQTAEPIKVLLILFMAGYLSRYDVLRRDIRLLVYAVFMIFAGGFYVLSNNMSTAMIICLMAYFTLFMIHPNSKWFLIVIAFGLIIAIIAVFIIDKIPYNEEDGFRLVRIKAWLHPTDPNYSDDQAYQAKMALYAIASGGFFGKGLGRSLVKFTLPEPHNDYILAVIFEELGVFGVLLLTLLYFFLLYRLFVIFKRCRDDFSRIVVLGVFFHLVFQILINYFVCLGLLPTMGVTLPFVSAGGASAFFTMAELGLCLGIERQNKETEIYILAEKEIQSEDSEYRRLLETKRAREVTWRNEHKSIRSFRFRKEK